MPDILNLLEAQLTTHIEATQKRRKASKKSKIQHYFAGQGDAFNQVLLELKILQYEQNLPGIEDDAESAEDFADVSQPEAVAEESPKRRKKAPKRKRVKPEDLTSEQRAAQELLQQAVQAGVIDQKISLYVYEDFPNKGRIRGKMPVTDLLVEDDALAEKIRQQVAEKMADDASEAAEGEAAAA